MSRVDLYGTVHKGIRGLLAGTAALAGRTDFARAEEAARAAAEVRRLLGFLDEHAHHEDTWVMPEVARIAPELHADLAADHVRTDGLHRELAGLAARVEGATEAERVSLGARIHERLWRLAAEHLRHMAREEADAQRVLWAHRTDEELGQLHGRLLASIPPARMAEWSAIILPALATRERAGMLAGMRAAMPPPVFERITAPARDALGPVEWAATAVAAGF
ncbi:hemerythrin domain-containing protein [Anaeromyxobacter oryzae]|uniref:Hemerythrin-like domain-containing protein n=1 Tax=Anaeromyxobacter oryzae TaxID=2918170 RepID=A0ABM7X0P0_9BACT|nr:hypothetical protein [Anaeromyxobacter oryzae]BDG05298.1 hypothetical protein AMOR_42940 [Anaeromyxobacter oryzae]